MTAPRGFGVRWLDTAFPVVLGARANFVVIVGPFPGGVEPPHSKGASHSGIPLPGSYLAAITGKLRTGKQSSVFSRHLSETPADEEWVSAATDY